MKNVSAPIDNDINNSKILNLFKIFIFFSVDRNSAHNLMNASNLSIVWGASLFPSAASLSNAFETGDFLRNNTLVKVLMQKYDDIFIDVDRLI